MQLFEFGKDQIDVVLRERALRVARHLRDLPRIKLLKNRSRQRVALGLQLRNLFSHIDIDIIGRGAELPDFLLQVRNRLFKL